MRINYNIISVVRNYDVHDDYHDDDDDDDDDFFHYPDISSSYELFYFYR